MDFVLGIDLGTSYFKLGLFDRGGRLRGLGRVAVPKATGAGDRCEVPVNRFWAALREGLQQARAEANAAPGAIAAVAYSSQANSFLLLDEQDEPLTPLILWPDMRAGRVPHALAAFGARTEFMQVTGLGMGLSPMSAVSKLHWLREHAPAQWERAQRFMTLADYFTYCITGAAVGDAGTAALLGLLDLRHQKQLPWWDEALAAAGLTPAHMSRLLRPGTMAGTVTAAGGRRLGIRPGRPFAVGSLDHHMAAIGAGAGQIAEVSESTGTVLAVLKYNRDYTPRPATCLGPGLRNYNSYQLAFSSNGGVALEWYRDTFAPDLPLPDLDRLAAEEDPGSDGLVARPMAEQHAGKEAFRGVRPDHAHGHFFRALMESVAGTLDALVDDLCGEARPHRIVATGGGARSAVWLQIMADVLGIEMVTSSCSEPACLGAAMFAAVAANWSDSLAEISEAWITEDRVVSPDTARHAMYREWLAAAMG